MLDGEVNQERALNIVENRLYRREYFVQLGSNIMITVGLIGTITGLIIAMTGLETVMTSLSESGDNIIGGLQTALSGMGTAFYTTLFGAILGGFFLKLLHQASSNMADEIIDEIAIKSEIHVLPFLKKTVENHVNAQSTQLLEYVNQSRQLLESESEKVRDYLSSIDDLKIVIHGDPCQSLVDRYPESKVTFCSSLVDGISYLHNAPLSICSNSGFGAFVLNCGSNLVGLMPEHSYPKISPDIIMGNVFQKYTDVLHYEMINQLSYIIYNNTLGYHQLKHL